MTVPILPYTHINTQVDSNEPILLGPHGGDVKLMIFRRKKWKMVKSKVPVVVLPKKKSAAITNTTISIWW